MSRADTHAVDTIRRPSVLARSGCCVDRRGYNSIAVEISPNSYSLRDVRGRAKACATKVVCCDGFGVVSQNQSLPGGLMVQPPTNYRAVPGHERLPEKLSQFLRFHECLLSGSILHRMFAVFLCAGCRSSESVVELS